MFAARRLPPRGGCVIHWARSILMNCNHPEVRFQINVTFVRENKTSMYLDYLCYTSSIQNDEGIRPVCHFILKNSRYTTDTTTNIQIDTLFAYIIETIMKIPLWNAGTSFFLSEGVARRGQIPWPMPPNLSTRPGWPYDIWAKLIHIFHACIKTIRPDMSAPIFKNSARFSNRHNKRI